MIAAGGTTFFLGFLAIGPLVAGPLAAGLGWLPSRLFGVRMRLSTSGARRNPSRTATTTVALTIGIGLMTLFSVVLSTANEFATHEMSRHFPADYLLSVKRGGIPGAVVTSLRASSQIAVAVGIREGTASVDGHQAQLLAAEPSAYRSVFMPLVQSGSLSAVETGTGGIALSGIEASALRVAAGGKVSVDGHPLVVEATFSDGVLGGDSGDLLGRLRQDLRPGGGHRGRDKGPSWRLGHGVRGGGRRGGREVSAHRHHLRGVAASPHDLLD